MAVSSVSTIMFHQRKWGETQVFYQFSFHSVPTFPALALAVVRTSWSITGLPTGLCTSTWPPFCWRAETNRNTETSGFWRRKDINKVLCTFLGGSLKSSPLKTGRSTQLFSSLAFFLLNQPSILGAPDPTRKKSEDLFIWFFCVFSLGKKTHETHQLLFLSVPSEVFHTLKVTS